MAISTEELRLQIGERIPPTGDESDTLFTDAELQLIIARGNDQYYLTLSHAWSAKAGTLSALIDTVEDGSQRSLNQRFRNAERMANLFGQKAVAEEEATIAELPRAVALGFDAYRCPNDTVDPNYVFHQTPTVWP